MRLALVISSLGLGGAERVLSRLAAGWAGQGVEVTLITLAGAENDFFTVPPQVKRVALGLMSNSTGAWQALGNNLQRLRALRRALRAARPEAVISFMDATNVLTILATRGLGLPVVVSERIDLAGHGAKLGRIWHTLRRLTYPRAQAVVAVTQAVARQLKELTSAGVVEAIPNPVEPGSCQGEPELLLDGPTVLGMGRLVPRKGFDLLTRAFHRCLPRHPDWKLVILGEGRDRPRLERLIRELGLQEKVRLAGRVREPGPVLAQAEIFALCSAYEGFPNALVEAMACGLAVVCADYAGGPGEIVGQGQAGLLVPVGDETALAAALDRLMADEELRRRLGREAQEAVRPYGLEAVLAQWNRLLSRVSGWAWPGGEGAT